MFPYYSLSNSLSNFLSHSPPHPRHHTHPGTQVEAAGADPDTPPALVTRVTCWAARLLMLVHGRLAPAAASTHLTRQSQPGRAPQRRGATGTALRALLPQIRRCAAAVAPAAARDAPAPGRTPQHWSRGFPPLSLPTASAFMHALSDPSPTAWDALVATELWTAPGDNGAVTRGAVLGTVFAAGDAATAAAAAIAFLPPAPATTTTTATAPATVPDAAPAPCDDPGTMLAQLRGGDFSALEALLEEVGWGWGWVMGYVGLS